MTTTAAELDNRRIGHLVPLVTPALLHHELPLGAPAADTVRRGREHVVGILDGTDDRLLVIAGPCSIHDPAAALDYADQLATLAGRLADDLLIVMRVYFEKPRTLGGWKGLINDPHLDDTGDVNHGLRVARHLLLELAERRLPAACEWLDTTIPAYLADTVSWGAIGARTVESQNHRMLASGLSMPVGFKNRRDGDITVAIDAIRAAAARHVVPGVDPSGLPAILHTLGNPDCHLVLRGGNTAPNHGPASVHTALAALQAAGLPRRVVIDASHDNSRKDHRRQPVVADEIAEQLRAGQTGIAGVMLESNLLAGRQDLRPGRPLTYGQSITDACIDLTTTRAVLGTLAAATAARRRSGRRAVDRGGERGAEATLRPVRTGTRGGPNR
ncbi:3-deoxy-7-phosphoheptulonate synthase [Amycolatopsis bartoniae]|uniref:Phospho-2-dehydro-3-deoxyheptonate aldolase n=1 Tax=Amycolatopsis bartoniae TaxID=941986 RepID=A0A8H9MBA4_9PSEU|nr:3-deoxy-7-phosphoheptulonate synthase [Amycolatopsis bartoniae]MBB2939779.1 3-deoxy-7-phosphoheptulonate synthase [Amycolatopsis bartoniae]TVT07511.1 3-deoxy-7-phosphoheptulonate synthase [Amycolatopsis bartoniae]GHF54437.1 phospho-2-dehydro-3-deoxyheptonate aldolase [Amycolatopsis bartoniae]